MSGALDPAFLDREFPSRRETLQFNTAAVCALPARAAAALGAFAARTSERGSLDWRDWDAQADRLRDLGARLFGVDAGGGGARSLSVVPNTSWGIGLVAEGLDWKAGESVVTTGSEFPSNLTPWLNLRRLGVDVRRVPTTDGAFTAGDVERLCDASTRVVCVSAVAYHTGFRAPVEELGAFCRSRGILFGLDAIQMAGSQPMDAAAWSLDFLAADGHKWMLSCEGCGFLFTRPELRERLRAPGGWSNLRHRAEMNVGDVPDYESDGRRFEPGSLATAETYALGASLGLIFEIGLDAIASRIAATLGVLVEGLPRLGFTPVLFGGPPRSGILAARPPDGKDARYYASRLAAERVAISARQGFLRFAPHVDSDEEGAARLLELIARL